MKVKLLFLMLFSGIMVNAAMAQDSTKIYSIEANARAQVDEAVKKAARDNKHVLLMVGGNWCKWCKMFNKFSHDDAQIDSLLKADFVVEHINFSKENKNLDLMKQLDFPQRFGFPVFVLLDAKGNRIHTQQTGYLEEGQGYSKEKVMEFLEQWSPKALLPEQYLK